MNMLGRTFAVVGVVLFAYASAQADDASQVQAASLEVKARIKSMEQVNVTAEKSIDETAPAASAKVAELLRELEAAEGDSWSAAAPLADKPSGLAAGTVLNKQ